MSQEELWFDSEITDIGICITIDSDCLILPTIDNDFSGFSFVEADGDTSALPLTCGGTDTLIWQAPTTRLIGFHVKTGPSPVNAVDNIRSIAAIFDTTLCDEAGSVSSPGVNPIADMSY